MRYLACFLVAALVLCTSVRAESLPGGTISVPGVVGTTVQQYLNPVGYDFAANPYSLDLTTLGPVTISGKADLTNAPTSTYYFVVKIVDPNANELSTVLTTAGLGGWHGIAAQPWDRVSGEASYYDPNWNPGGSVEKWFSTLGGTTDSDYDGAGAGTSGDVIVGSDRIYDFAMTVDPVQQSLGVKVWANGITNSAAKVLYDLGQFSVDNVFNDAKTLDFDWAHTQLMVKLYTAGDDGSVNYWDLDISPIPAAPVPLPAAAWAGMVLFGLITTRRARAS